MFGEHKPKTPDPSLVNKTNESWTTGDANATKIVEALEHSKLSYKRAEELFGTIVAEDPQTLAFLAKMLTGELPDRKYVWTESRTKADEVAGKLVHLGAFDDSNFGPSNPKWGELGAVFSRV